MQAASSALDDLAQVISQVRRHRAWIILLLVGIVCASLTKPYAVLIRFHAVKSEVGGLRMTNTMSTSCQMSRRHYPLLSVICAPVSQRYRAPCAQSVGSNVGGGPGDTTRQAAAVEPAGSTVATSHCSVQTGQGTD